MNHPRTTSPTRSHAHTRSFPRSLAWAKHLPAVALGLLLVLPACDSNDEDETAFDRFDADGNAQIDADEFGTAFSRLGDFDTFDVDQSESLDEDEFYEGTLGIIDTDDSGDIDEEEFDAGVNLFRLNADNVNFDNYDADESGTLDLDEYTLAGPDVGSFDRFDADLGGTVDEGEFNDAVFTAFDRDVSGGIDEDEFDVGNEFFGVDRF
jgi:Ca2+-binding EF-hand superfamily protein